MGRYGEGTHLNELLGKRGETPPEECTYCTRAHSKGFTRCPSCETLFKVNAEGDLILCEKLAGLEMEY
jgi:hypothetical protein